jgi:hypothetical protein
MKKIYLLLMLFFGAYVFTACEDDPDANPIPEEVQSYIDQLVAGNYPENKLPDFTMETIPYLLQYRNDRTEINSYPVNPISSYYQETTTLGMFVLWTIESIRVKYIAADQLILNFPSQNPTLALRDQSQLQLVDTQNSQQVAADAYFTWWQQSTTVDIFTLRTIDPLEDTPYRWH